MDLTVGFADLLQLSIRKRSNAVGKASDRCAGAGNFLLQIQEFARAEDARMACHYLLNEGRAGARHADDKDGGFGWVGGATSRVDEALGEHSLDSGEPLQDLLQAQSHLSRLEVISLREEADGLFGLIQIGEHLSQGEQKLPLVDFR